MENLSDFPPQAKPHLATNGKSSKLPILTTARPNPEAFRKTSKQVLP
jgi:hypothetical protein